MNFKKFLKYFLFFILFVTNIYAGDKQLFLKQTRDWNYDDPAKGTPYAVWLSSSGELPPDFDTMPSLPFPPNLLMFSEGKPDAKPVTNIQEWEKKRAEMKNEIMKWITGTVPPAPKKFKVKELTKTKDGINELRKLKLVFGPKNAAFMHLQMLIPAGKGPFPVIMGPSGWDVMKDAVNRGYIVCMYAGSDKNNDSWAYKDIWPEYDFSDITRRAWGASRVIDYLYTQKIVDKNKIAITGHSRNGKQALWTAAFDERITGAAPNCGGTLGENLIRYSPDKYNTEPLRGITGGYPYWAHSRIRFFVGREQKLPVDMNSIQALVAPRALILGTAINDIGGGPWGIEQSYLSVKRVYKLLEKEDNLSMLPYFGGHNFSIKTLNSYLDFFDYAWGRSTKKPEVKQFYNYSFEKWKELSKAQINLAIYPVKTDEDLLKNENDELITTVKDWENRKKEIIKHIKWAIGAKPADYSFTPVPNRDFGQAAEKPLATSTMGKLEIKVNGANGKYVYTGYLYYPINAENYPVVIYLNPLAHSTGFNGEMQSPMLKTFIEKGIAVFGMDMIGCGTRIEEVTDFYNKYPHWTKMGKMIDDVKYAVDILQKQSSVNKKRIYVFGYSLGGSVALFSALFDNRINGVATLCGFTPLRTATADKGIEGIYTYSHLQGLLPRLGYFINGNENRIPFDFNEIIACLAPRPVMIDAPQWDSDAVFSDVVKSVESAKKVYGIYNKKDNLILKTPDDWNHIIYATELQQEIADFFVIISKK
ncbi:MAG: hypothetical protein A2551_06785 [Elusimicrobia bacterium RIFOXYD2_FULL_34_30]|nr:MAG: hypothetical protein A2551_06785 [Elusimicrobia bacterium RIFOXYD2_FULL_34_30]